jgi:release factor glutamine methyltransferase
MEMTVRQILKKGVEILGNREYLNPTLDALLILCYLLNVDKIYIYTHMDQVVSKEIVDKYMKLIKTRKKGYPLQYILKKQEFMGLELFVDEGALIPRPDTEILVEHVIDVANKRYSDGKDINIIDIGTGSGAIAISIAYYIENAKVYSVDISSEALEVAKKNVEKFQLDSKVKLIKGNLFESLNTLQLDNKIDIIVSNPPYIDDNEISNLQAEIGYEPRIALSGGIDGLWFYRKIIPESKTFLKSGGFIAFEIGYDQGKKVETILKEEGFEDIRIIKDLSGFDRVVSGILTRE